MRQEAIYAIRLLRMADYLEETIKEPEPDIREVLLEWPLNHLNVFYHCKYNLRMFDCLLDLFGDHWEFDEELFQEPQLKSLPDYKLSRGFIYFFGLKSPIELIHLFDTHGSYQDIERWGGTYLIETSTSWDVAYNIREFVSHKG